MYIDVLLCFYSPCIFGFPDSPGHPVFFCLIFSPLCSVMSFRFCQLKIKDLYMIATDKKGLPRIRERDVSYMFVNETTSEVDLQMLSCVLITTSWSALMDLLNEH